MAEPPGFFRTLIDAYRGASIVLEHAMQREPWSEESTHRVLRSRGLDRATHDAFLERYERIDEGNPFAALAGFAIAAAYHPVATRRTLSGFIADRHYPTDSRYALERMLPLGQLLTSYDAHRMLILHAHEQPIEAERLEEAREVARTIESYVHEPLPRGLAIGRYAAETMTWMYLPRHQAMSQSVGPVKQESKQTFGTSSRSAQ